jgi:hypothetical protein
MTGFAIIGILFPVGLLLVAITLQLSGKEIVFEIVDKKP